jgi:hypothetical protein
MSVYNPPIEDITYNSIDYTSVNTAIITPDEADARYVDLDVEPTLVIGAGVYSDPIYMGTGSGTGSEVERNIIKKVRIIRVVESTGATGTNANLISALELQIWVGGVNVALTATATTNNQFSTFTPNKLNDGSFANTNRAIAGASSNTNIGDYIQLAVGSAFSINALQSVVYYGDVFASSGAISTNSQKRQSGLQLQLLDTNDTILYASIVFGSNDSGSVGNFRYCRIDGGSLPTTNLSSSPTTTNIVQPTDTSQLLKSLLPVDTAPANIKKIRLVRKADSSPAVGYSNENLIVSEEIQVWIGGVNIAADLSPSAATMSDVFDNGAQYAADKVIDDVVGNNSLKSMCGSSNDTNINEFISITLASNISVTDIESIVHFADDATSANILRQKGLVIQLLTSANVVLYQTANFPVSNGSEIFYRFDGVRLPLEYFTTFSSSAVKTKIIQSATANQNEIFKIPTFFATPTNTGCIGIGIDAGASGQEQNSIAIGHSPQEFSASESCIGIGVDAGRDFQGQYGSSGADDGIGRSISLGKSSGKENQRNLSMAIGYLAGEEDQGINTTGGDSGEAIAIGRAAGRYNQGSSSIAIGKWAGYGLQGASSQPQKPNTINFASPNPIGSSAVANPNALYFENIRFIDLNDAGMASAGFRRLHYNTTTKELNYYVPP